ncbi:MAG: hypothetical protein Q9193_006986, partial [Seirophora villosa]
LNTPRARSPLDRVGQPRTPSQPPSKSVQFDLDTPDTSSPNSPEHIRRRRQRNSNHSRDDDDDEYSTFSDDPSTSSSSRPQRHRKHRHDRDAHPPPAPSNPNSSATTLVNSARSPSPTSSDATVELPQRFDEKGRKIPEEGEDPLGSKIEDLLGGGGGIGKFLKGFMGGENDPLGDGGNKGRSRRRRRRD